MEKTIEEWLNELPDPYKTQALANAENAKVLKHKVSHMGAAIGSFVWVHTPEGGTYWSKLQQIL